MIIDAHGHLVPPDLLAAIRKEHARFPSLRLIEDGGSLALAFAGGKPTRPIIEGAERRRRRGSPGWTSRASTARWSAAGPTGSATSCRRRKARPGAGSINEAQLAAAKAEPRFVPLATVPLQDGARAAAVLKAAMAAGFPGAMIGTLPRGIGSVLDAADLDPFWAAADETGAVIHIHPSYDAGDVRVNDYGLANGVGRITDAIVAVARLMCSGHVTRYRNARIFVPMGAAGLPFLLGRLKRNHQDHARHRRSGRGARACSIPTASCTTRGCCDLSSEMLGADRVMMGSDMPFPIGDEEPMKIVAAAGLKPDQVASINGGLAAKLFRIG